MKHLFRTTPRKVALVVAVLVAVAAGSAFAYFSGSGSASKPANGGHAPSLTLTIGTIADSYPGAAVSVPVHIAYSGQGNARVGKIVAASPLISGQPSGCLASWFSFADVPVNQTLASGGSTDVTGSLAMSETGASQDACVDAALTVNLTTAP